MTRAGVEGPGASTRYHTPHPCTHAPHPTRVPHAPTVHTAPLDVVAGGDTSTPGRANNDTFARKRGHVASGLAGFVSFRASVLGIAGMGKQLFYRKTAVLPVNSAGPLLRVGHLLCGKPSGLPGR